MGKYEDFESRNQKPASGPHADYEKNLGQARNFCATVEKSLVRGLKVKVVDSEQLKNALLMISFRPPPEAKMGNYATPINLHQPNQAYNKKVEVVFNAYVKKFRGVWPEPKQDLFEDQKLFISA